ncbi:hypothetical protein LAJ55_13000, partial [Streptococcus pneumoniae]|uniref:hypothetical protein n=1 Tax=Streptococcus pneumoniae TaxID=1313 RepID=UPI001CC0EC03
DAQTFCSAVISAEKELVGIVKPEEKRLQSMQDEWDAAREAERKAAEVERARIAAEQEKLRRDDPIAAITSPAPEMPELPKGPAEVKVSIGGGFGRASG